MQQIRRLGVPIVGHEIILRGVVMLVTPGLEWLAVLLGLGSAGRLCTLWIPDLGS